MVRLAAAVELGALLAALLLGGVRGLVALVIAGSVVRALRGQRWFDAGDGDRVAAWTTLFGALIGAAGLAAALAATPMAVDVVGHAVEWSTAPVVRGSPSQLAVALVVAVATGLAAELVYRRWLLERAAQIIGEGIRVTDPAERDAVRRLAGGAAVVVAALAEALIARGDPWTRLGALVAGLGLGALYLGAGRRVGVAVAARVTFEVGALILQSGRWIG